MTAESPSAPSQYLVHYTTEGTDLPPPADDAVEMAHVVREQWTETSPDPAMRLMCILADACLWPGEEVFGMARNVAPDPDSQRAVCFTEAPLGSHDTFLERYSDWGIAFSVKDIAMRGGAPVWYLPRNHGPYKAARALVDAHAEDPPESPFWTVAPFIQWTGEFVTSSGRISRREFQWEREWRLPGGFGLGFDWHEVKFILAPAADHQALHEFLAVEGDDRLGLAQYDCPLIDPKWSKEQVAQAISAYRRRGL